MDAKVFLIKVIQISFSTLNQMEENASKYSNVKEEYAPKYVVPTTNEEWIKLNFSKDFLDRVKTYEDYNFMGKFIFEKA